MGRGELIAKGGGVDLLQFDVRIQFGYDICRTGLVIGPLTPFSNVENFVLFGKESPGHNYCLCVDLNPNNV